MAREITEDNDYKTRLLKLIPGDFIAAYLAIDKAVPEGTPVRRWTLTVATLFLLLLLPFTLRYLYKVESWLQIGATSGSFIVWAYSIGGPFIEWNVYEAAIATVSLTLWTLVLPLFHYREPS
jgi:hypothetical protein